MKVRHTIVEIAKTIKPDRSVFKIELSDNKRYLSAKPLGPSSIKAVAEGDDLLTTLTKENVSQGLTSSKTYYIDPDSTSNNVIYAIYNKVSKFVGTYGTDIKSRPKIYKWIANDVQRKMWDRTSFNDELGEGMYLLYKYILSFEDAIDEKHVKNCYAILGAMMEKYGPPAAK